MKIQERNKNKFMADKTFEEEYGDVEKEPMLSHHELIAMKQTNFLYLVDGNNIMPTNKHFRKYFQNMSQEYKIEAQIRCRWLISLALAS